MGASRPQPPARHRQPPRPPVPPPTRYAVVGTAGHIDHGKSALVKALTGTDPDRLEEEKRRGMTIDLGFAHLDLPHGRRVGIVDVPGHERLIRNMLAGATGIDLVLFVVAADEGVMPQTREHLDILRFLGLRRGIVVLNKVDLVADPEWLGLVTDEIRTLTAGSFLEGAPVLPVSARTGEGLERLTAAIEDGLAGLAPRPADAPARVPIDRCFTMAGFGTVVTGTLWSGRIRVGDALELLPAGVEVRVRHVQSHGVAVEEALAGQRVALNIVGAAKDQITRGHVLAAPHTMHPAELVDVRIRLLPETLALGHHDRVRMYAGADEVIGRVRLLDRGRLAPGETAAAQLRLERPAVVARGDPFVLRRYSPMITIGGGEIITVQPPLRRRTTDAAAAVAAGAAADLADRVASALAAAGRSGTTAETIAQEIGEGRDRVAAQIRAWDSGEAVIDLRGRLFSAEAGRTVERDILRVLAEHHEATPWRRGIPRDELKARAFGSGDDRLYSHALEDLAARRQVAVEGEFVRLEGFTPARSPAEREARERIEDAFRQARYAPPVREEALALIPDRAAADRMFQALVDEGILVPVGDGIVFHRDVLEDIKGLVVAHVAAHGEITVAGLRDLLGSSRKYTLTVLEYFDAIRLTRRIGDKRTLVRPPSR